MGPLERSLAFFSVDLPGRGWVVSPYPVLLEPPFSPFQFPPPEDTSRREHFLVRLGRRLLGRFGTQDEARGEEPVFPVPAGARTFPEEYRVTFSESPKGAEIESLLRAILPREALSFEVLARKDEVAFAIAGRGETLERSLALIPRFIKGRTLKAEHFLASPWMREGDSSHIVELGLAEPWLLPLRVKGRDDFLQAFAGTISRLEKGDFLALQVLATVAHAPWQAAAREAALGADGRSLLSDLPRLGEVAKEKLASPIFATVLRVALKADPSRGKTLLRSLVGDLSLFGERSGNSLVPLLPEEGITLEGDLLLRSTHRSGMLLSLGELAALIPWSLALGGSSSRRTKEAPRREEGLLLGENVHEGRKGSVYLPLPHRFRHLHVAGATGGGKSTFLARLILEDLAAGQGLALLDPHGDLVEEVLARIPSEREEDVILFDPRSGSSPGLNILAAESDEERTLLEGDLVALFKRYTSSWGDLMSAALGNAVSAFLSSSRGGTLLDLRRFFREASFRESFLSTVEDEDIRSFFREESGRLKESFFSLALRLDAFLRPKPLRAIFSSASPLSLPEVMGEGKVLLARLSSGALGEENAGLLGGLLLAKFHQAALLRDREVPTLRRPFFLYLDECHTMATPSLSLLLSGARKYKVGLTLAHQSLRQLEGSGVKDALLANAGTRVVFRVGEEDARIFEKGFPSFEGRDLLSLRVGEALVRFPDGEDFNLRIEALPPADLTSASRVERIRSRLNAPYDAEAVPTEVLVVEVAEPSLPAAEIRPPEVIPTAAPSPSPTPKRSIPAAKLAGRGGAEHLYLQEFLKQAGDAKGFRSEIEKSLPQGGRADLAFTRGSLSIACEISVTTSAEHEAQNLEKCLKAPFSYVVLLSKRKRQVATVRKELQKKLPPDDFKRLAFLLPEEFPVFLESFPDDAERETIAGYKVRMRYGKESPEKGKRVAEVLAKSFRRPP